MSTDHTPPPTWHGRYDAPEPSKVVRCGDCNDRGWKRNNGMSAACACVVHKVADLEAEVARLRALLSVRDLPAYDPEAT